ncbi:hypothetical protein K443DRAFT_273119 [Laccaria amethystina LaAM-08-1]|uniref:Uncharacterized protein n=1 Tax=Laccaria amethystina LaAM-08-1 TaxID=1095629 RepID=A0A0C9XKN9_9AGAR|nr:hypothetical protein K443DRAFT_273119 [Laccaria amethystina LaAM-08-1]
MSLEPAALEVSLGMPSSSSFESEDCSREPIMPLTLPLPNQSWCSCSSSLHQRWESWTRNRCLVENERGSYGPTRTCFDAGSGRQRGRGCGVLLVVRTFISNPTIRNSP